MTKKLTLTEQRIIDLLSHNGWASYADFNDFVFPAYKKDEKRKLCNIVKVYAFNLRKKGYEITTWHGQGLRLKQRNNLSTNNLDDQ